MDSKTPKGSETNRREPAAITSSVERVVRAEDTAAQYGSHFPPAAATPFVLGLAEVASHNCVATGLSDGEVTVGTSARIEHLLPSPVGATLVATATLVHRQGRRLSFEISVLDGDEVCARVTHDRAIVSIEAINGRLAARA